MSFGVDYAWGYKPSLPAALKAAGATFACRYISTPGNPKNLTKDESVALRRQGLQVVTVFETTAGRALSGRAGGVYDAKSAVAQLRDLGAPVDAPVYFAVDFDATDAQKPLIAQYLNGAASVLGHERVGVYGSYYVVKYMAEHEVCDWFWQTYAWSGGLLYTAKTTARALIGRVKHRSAHLYQYRNGQRIDGVSVDFNKSLSPDYGQWFGRPAPPTPTPPPPVTPSVFPKDDGFWTWLRWRDGTGEFTPYGARNPDVRPNVPKSLDKNWWDGLAFFHAKRPQV